MSYADATKVARDLTSVTLEAQTYIDTTPGMRDRAELPVFVAKMEALRGDIWLEKQYFPREIWAHMSASVDGVLDRLHQMREQWRRLEEQAPMPDGQVYEVLAG